MRKAQGAFEYVLILAGVLFIVVLAILVLQSLQVTQSSQVEENLCTSTLVGAPQCYNADQWNAQGVVIVSQSCLKVQADLKTYAGTQASDCPAAPVNNFYYIGPDVNTPTGWCCGRDPRT